MKKRAAFTLIEMSVVIAIIGITSGGILIAQTLIRSSHLNRMLGEYDTFIKAINEFQEKFLAFPGDMTNAESMWGSDLVCPYTPTNTTPKLATCNGNGDGKIGDSTTAGVLSNSREWFRAWQQLGGSGFITDQYTGTPGSVNVTDAVPGVNVPSSSLSVAGWTLHNIQMTSADNGLWRDQYGHILDFGMSISGNRTIGAVLTPVEALVVDAKVDDGKPGTGIIRAWRTSVLPGCTTGDTTQALQKYGTSDTSKDCSLFFLLSF